MTDPEEVQTVTEPGVYRLMMMSTTPEAERFKRWVFHEVLPTIRQYGTYPKPDILEGDRAILTRESGQFRTGVAGVIFKDLFP